MKKKLIYTGLLLALLTMTTACGSDSKTDSTSNDSSKNAATQEPSKSPLPTADTTVTENEKGDSVCKNTSDGYTIVYDKNSFEMTNEGHTISIHMPENKKNDNTKSDSEKKGANTYNKDGSAVDNSYMNVFCTITVSDDLSADDYKKSLQTAYKGKYKKKEVKIGADKITATQYVISDSGGIRHEMYVAEGKDKVYMIELKCAKSQKKTYNSKLTSILNSLTFN